MSQKKNRMLRQKVREVFKDKKNTDLEKMYKIAKRFVSFVKRRENEGNVEGRV